MSQPDQETGPPPTDQGRIARLKQKAGELRTQAVSRLDSERQRRRSVRIAFDFYQRDRAFAGSLLAGGLAVKLFLWFLPFALTVVVAVGSFADRLDRPPEDIAQDTGLAASLAAIVADAVEETTRARIYLGVLGAFLMIWAGIGVAKAVRLVSRLAWELPPPGRYNQVVASLGVAGFVLALLLANRALAWMLGGPVLTDLLTIGLMVAVSAAILVILFRRLPHAADTPWTAMVPGALLMTVGLLGTRLVTIVYLGPRLSVAPDLYGALGLAGVFLAWLYIIARVLVGAISLNATIWLQRSGAGLGTTTPLIEP